MARHSWWLQDGLPLIEIELRNSFSFPQGRLLLADTGGAPLFSAFALILTEEDGAEFGGPTVDYNDVGGMIGGRFPIKKLTVEIPALSYSALLRVLCVPANRFYSPLQGVACFNFLNRFSYGNFGNPAHFGLENLPNPSQNGAAHP